MTKDNVSLVMRSFQHMNTFLIISNEMEWLSSVNRKNMNDLINMVSKTSPAKSVEVVSVWKHGNVVELIRFGHYRGKSRAYFF